MAADSLGWLPEHKLPFPEPVGVMATDIEDLFQENDGNADDADGELGVGFALCILCNGGGRV